MSTREVYRYSWIKVSDDDGRAQMMRAALGVQHSLQEHARAAQPGSAEAGFLRTQLVMARAYLGGEVEHGIRAVIFSPAEGGSLSLDLVTPLPFRNAVPRSLSLQCRPDTRARTHSLGSRRLSAPPGQGARSRAVSPMQS